MSPRSTRPPTSTRSRRDCCASRPAIGRSSGKAIASRSACRPGFIEPLEASAIVLIELSLRALADNFPASRRAMPIHAERFNRLFALRWRRIADFLKLHYVLSRRDEPYWRAQRDPATISPELGALLELWRDQPPSAYDFPLAEEIFPAASHQYVYYGMTGRPARAAAERRGGGAAARPGPGTGAASWPRRCRPTAPISTRLRGGGCGRRG